MSSSMPRCVAGIQGRGDKSPPPLEILPRRRAETRGYLDRCVRLLGPDASERLDQIPSEAEGRSPPATDADLSSRP